MSSSRYTIHSDRMPCPQSATSRQESEMQDNSQRELQALENTGDLIERLRLVCLSKGAHGILGLGRLFHLMDDFGNNHLTMQQFTNGLRKIGMEITDEEAQELFSKFDTDGSGTINIDEFLVHVRPPMSQSRIKDIEDAFRKLDKSGDGEITINDLRRVYNVKADPRYLSGEDSEESILEEFIGHFERGVTRDGKITKEEFFNYYSGISASIDNDGYFDLMIRQVYKL